jgi:hypothetical protein
LWDAEVDMSTMTYAAPRFWERRHHGITTATLVMLFWAVAAVLVTVAHQTINPISPIDAVLAKICAIGFAAFLYIKLTAREATINHALLVGIVWIVLSIAAEITATASGGRGWFALLGSPADPVLRDILLFVWVGAPTLFVRARS